jgi:nitrate/nitrite-specific signal transduction histidine kinase
MIMFSGMVLVLTVGAVCALLYRQVFLPIKQLVDFTEMSPDDSLDSDFPEASGEVAKLAKAFRDMTARVNELEGRQDKNTEDPSTDSTP